MHDQLDGPVTMVLPERDSTLGGAGELLVLERAGLEAELGAPVVFACSDPGAGRRWRLVLDEGHESSPETSWDPGTGLIESRARDAAGLLEALNLWRTLRRLGGGRLAATDCSDLDEAIRRVTEEVADTYPAFELRGLDWPAICRRHADAVAAAPDPLAALQRWLAELEDSHTWAWPGHANLPYAVRLSRGAATFTRVLEPSEGFAAGVRPGWLLVELDGEPPDVEGWLSRTAAPPHSRPYLAGRRLLAGPADERRELVAAGPDGTRITWHEAPATKPAGEPARWERLASGAAYLRIDAWRGDAGVDERIDAAFAELRRCDRLILDLRANPGGSLTLACATRDRFLRERTELGSIRYSTGGGRVSLPTRLLGEPADPSRRWPGRLIVLTDELTFSSSEDFLLGLQGLPHVAVVGRRSGGGSGRPRSIRLLPGWLLTVSTALTYDREGRCIEGAGIPVDVEVREQPSPNDPLLRAAEAL
jgi:carboxyl-terminal processing protease